MTERDIITAIAGLIRQKEKLITTVEILRIEFEEEKTRSRKLEIKLERDINDKIVTPANNAIKNIWMFNVIQIIIFIAILYPK
jgi:hypothetical protein